MAQIIVLFPVQSHHHYALRALPVVFTHTVTRSFLRAFVWDLPHSAQDSSPSEFCSTAEGLVRAWPTGFLAALESPVYSVLCASALYSVYHVLPLLSLSGLFPQPKNWR